MSKRKNKKLNKNIDEKIKWLLNEDKVIMDSLYDELMQYIPNNLKDKLRMTYEEMMTRREREIGND
jgi:hypothetical protein